jgi:CDP-diacylglycerol--serine O-phosphatidyltransferase
MMTRRGSRVGCIRRVGDSSIAKIVPNSLTVLGLCSGATAIYFALGGDWKNAVCATFVAMLFDVLDGQTARVLGVDSLFGAQLDSLGDVVSFGVAPALLIYQWSLSQIGTGGWIAAVIFCASSAVRLARFNAESAWDEAASPQTYFTGLPTPAATGILLLPLLLTFEFDWQGFRNPVFCTAVVALTSGLMVSRIPTPSLKCLLSDPQMQMIAVVVTALLVLAGIYIPWATLITGWLIYVGALPFAAHALLKHDRLGRGAPLLRTSQD